MYIILCILGLFILLTALYLFLIMPRLKKPPIGSAPLTTCHFAHRGYFNLQEGIPENTLLAFARAAAAGYGAELDVHLTKDHKLAVIHDSHLQNLCGCDSIIEEMNWQEVRSLRIQNSPYGIPTLREVLDAVKGTVPLLIEIKGKNVEPLMPLVMKELEAYQGLFCIESFNPLHLRWLKKHRPDILRGQLSCKYGWKDRKGAVEKLGAFAMEKLLCNVLSRPDFIAYSYPDAGILSVKLNRKMGALLAGWTVRDEKELELSKAKGITVQIFENIQP